MRSDPVSPAPPRPGSALGIFGRRRTPAREPAHLPAQEHLAAGTDLPSALREFARAQGGGAFLGLCAGGWVSADPEHAVLVLGPPRSGKTSAVVIPALLAYPGAVVSTSTKPDVLAATVAARASAGEVWLFDPTGEHPPGSLPARTLSWSPVAAATSWDEALHTARAMTLAAPTLGRGTQHEQHWSERAAALLAPLLHAAHISQEPIQTVLGWVLRHELEEPTKTLARAGATIAVDVLLGIGKTDSRERSSIFSATAGVLALYNTDAARHAAANPNFDPDVFAASTDTIYITAPAHRQALCAPLVVGLLEQIRHATYRRSATHPRSTPVFFCLDELANIAPIPDLPALASEAGGQGLHLMACLQDLSQARTRWSDAAADGFLTLFQTKLLLPAISDPHTLESLSLILGEIDRPMPNHSTGTSHSRTGWISPTTRTHSHTHGYTITRQRRLPPGDIANLPPGHALLIQGTTHRRIRLAPHHTTEPWQTLTQSPSPRRLPNETGGDATASYANPRPDQSSSDSPAAHRSQP